MPLIGDPRFPNAIAFFLFFFFFLLLLFVFYAISFCAMD